MVRCTGNNLDCVVSGCYKNDTDFTTMCGAATQSDQCVPGMYTGPVCRRHIPWLG